MTTHPSTEASLAGRVARWLDLRSVAGAVLAVLLLRLLYGLVALAISAGFPQTPLEQQVGLQPGGAALGQWLQRCLAQPWLRYDAWNYLRIVDHGYRLEEGTAAFHPLYPLLAWPLAWLTGNQLLALLVVSTAASAAACLLFARYVASLHDPALAQRAGWLLLLTPPAFILLAPYTESLFLAFAVAALYAMQRGHWWLAGALGALATLTRQQGLALLLPLLWCQLVALRRRAISPWQLAAGLLIPASYALFILYRASALGDLAQLASARGPAELLDNLLVSHSSEQVVEGQRIAWPWEALADELRLIGASFDYALIIDTALGWAMVLAVLLGLRAMTVAERIYALAIVALSLCYYNGDRSPYLGLPRHMLLAVPLFIALARWLGPGRRLRLYLELAGIFNLFLVAAFIRRGWIP